MRLPWDLSSPRTYTVTATDGSTQNHLVIVKVSLNSADIFTTFSIKGNPTTIDHTNHTIFLAVPDGTNLTAVKPVITYLVQAADGSTQIYTAVCMPPPGNLTQVATGNRQTSIALSWTDNSAQESCYLVERRTGSPAPMRRSPHCLRM